MTDTTDLSVRVAEALALREKATAGPWTATKLGDLMCKYPHRPDAWSSLCWANDSTSDSVDVLWRKGVDDANLAAASHSHVDLIADLNQARLDAERLVPKWLPIESAPKNGTWIIGYLDYGGALGIEIYRMKFIPRDEIWFTEDVGTLRDIPTHWMPLPAPPQTEAKS